jgi:hypothetical protein
VSPSSSPLVEAEFLQELLKTLGPGVAVADPESREIVFENAQFFDRFGPDEEVKGFGTQRVFTLDGELEPR